MAVSVSCVGKRDGQLPGSPAHSRRWSETVRWCETDALLARWRADGDRAAREELVTRFLPLARKLAARYHPSPESLEDLEQVASLGLLAAIERFDPARDIPFTAFAVPTILGELKHYYRNTGWAVHVPSSAQELAVRVDRAAQEITPRSGHGARIAELAKHLEVTTEAVLAGVDAAKARYSVSLDASTGVPDGNGGAALADGIGAEDLNYEMVERALSLSAAVTSLPEVERQALTLRLDCAMKQTEIARQLNCSQTQVSRLLRRAAVRLHGLIDPPIGELEASPTLSADVG
jgi:RNA polymerase sigma-B factor